MYRLIILLVMLSSFGFASAQPSSKERDNIALTVYLDKNKTIVPTNAMRILQNKMQQIVSKNGIGGMKGQRFILTANANELSKDITATIPPMHAITLEVSFYIGDGVDGTLFSSISITGKGVGETEDKAYIAALKSVNVSSSDFTSFVAEGKDKILAYYDSKIDVLISEANARKSMQDYDGAIAVLMQVPEGAKVAYMKAMETLQDIYSEKIDLESSKYLNEAKSIWSSGRDIESARDASVLLAKIHPDTKAFSEADALRTEIEKRLKELDQREYEMAVKRMNQEHELQKSYIEACRDVAVAEAENRPDVILYTYYWW